MAHPYWPLFDLRVRTPRLELRGIDDEMATELATLAAQGVHDPDFMPFAFEWTDVEPPQLQVNTMQFYWRCRAEWTPTAWNLNLAVVEEGVVVGTTGLMANHFPALRTFESGSWLGRAHHGRGIGTEMRIATLHLGFLGFGARTAITTAFYDNGPSLGVTRKLGYTPNGESEKVRRGTAARSLHFTMSAEQFGATARRDDVELIGVEPCLRLFGL
jgi:RimJ/RimL family protein N-acetyltransferase